MSRQTKQNPDWSDAILHRFCDPILHVAKKHNLPAPLLNEECKIEDRSELGEGAYGVVWTTEDASVAFKLSTDSTEAHFIQTAINMRKKGIADPAGIVDYRAIFLLPSVKHLGGEVFAIWREQATRVGLPCDVAKSDKEMIDFISLMQKFYSTSDAAFALAFAEQRAHDGDMNAYFDWIEERVDIANDIIDGKDPKHESPFSKLLAQCYRLAIRIEDSGEPGRHVGEALLTYFENGLLLCDIHGDNLGLLDRGKCRDLWAITDPGHSLLLDRNLVDVDIATLKE